MPVRSLTAVGFMLITFCFAGQASGNWFTEFFKGVGRDVKRRQCWPEPFVAADRAAVDAPFCAMVSNGWRKQNLLGRYHFSAETGELNEAGRQKVRWILTVCPVQHRLVYVHVAASEQETLARRKAVEKLIGRIARDNPPPVLTTSISEEGWSAEEADRIGRKYRDSIPKPRLPSDSGQEGEGGSMSY